jgi:hypothetical protein
MKLPQCTPAATTSEPFCLILRKDKDVHNQLYSNTCVQPPDDVHVQCALLCCLPGVYILLETTQFGRKQHSTLLRLTRTMWLLHRKRWTLPGLEELWGATK